MEFIIGLIIGIVGVLIALWGIWYAHKSYLIAKKAPIVLVSYYDVKHRRITNSAPLSQASFQFREDGYSQPIEFPIVLKNIGRLSAKNVQLNVRYPGALKVHSSGERIVEEHDPVLSMCIIVAHRVSNLQPQAQVIIKDTIEVPKYFFEGISNKVHATTKNDVPVKVAYRIEFSLIVECITLCDDSLPTYARIELFDKDRQDNTKKVQTKQ